MLCPERQGSDAVVTVSRIKPHTDFRGRYESGIVKMLVIGLGKRDGAAQHHRWGVRGLRDMIPQTARVVLEKARLANSPARPYRVRGPDNRDNTDPAHPVLCRG